MTRRSIDIDGFRHGAQPIPAASRIGPLVMTGGVHGVDRDTGAIPEDLDGQVSHMFANLKSILEAAGASLDDIIKVNVRISAPDARARVNEAWKLAFPNPRSRPARHTITHSDLPPPIIVQCEAIAYVAEASMPT